MNKSRIVIGSLLVGGFVVPTTSALAGASEVTYSASGMTSNEGVQHTFTCPSGYYVKNAGGPLKGTVLDLPYIDTSGTDTSAVGHGYSSSSSVGWGHFGSVLSTGLTVYLVNIKGTENHPFKISMICTTSQDDAWKIFHLGSNHSSAAAKARADGL